MWKADGGYQLVALNWCKVLNDSDNTIKYFSQEKYIKWLEIRETLILSPAKDWAAVSALLWAKLKSFGESWYACINEYFKHCDL